MFFIQELLSQLVDPASDAKLKNNVAEQILTSFEEKCSEKERKRFLNCFDKFVSEHFLKGNPDVYLSGILDWLVITNMELPKDNRMKALERIGKIENECCFLLPFLAKFYSVKVFGCYDLEKRDKCYKKLSAKGDGHATLMFAEAKDNCNHNEIMSLYDLSIKQGYVESYFFRAQYLHANEKINNSRYIQMLKEGSDKDSGCCCVLLVGTIIDNYLEKYKKKYIYGLIEKVEIFKSSNSRHLPGLSHTIDNILSWRSMEILKELVEDEGVKSKKKNSRKKKTSSTIKSDINIENGNSSPKQKYQFINLFYDKLSIADEEMLDDEHYSDTEETYEGKGGKITLRKNRYA